MKNPLKDKLKNGQTVVGTWLSIGNATIAEILSKAGCEWIAVEMEHSSINIKDAENLIRTIELCGSVPLVRMSSNDPVLAKRLMDIGAYGVIVPNIKNKEEAKKAVQSVKYPPQGIRGVGLYRAQEFGNKFDEYKNTANDESVVIVQIEDREGVENIEEIVGVEGVDGVFLGPYDLSCSLGVIGEIDHPLVQEAANKVLQTVRKAGKAAGIHVVKPDVDLLDKKIKEGYNFIAYSTDAIILNEQYKKAFINL